MKRLVPTAALVLLAFAAGALPPAVAQDPTPPVPAPGGPAVSPTPPAARSRNSAPPKVGEPANKSEKTFAARVNTAIDEGVLWLKKQPTIDGSFGRIESDVNYAGGTGTYDYPVGPTALALYTLLKCGVPPEDPVIQKGFAFIKGPAPVRRRGDAPATSFEIPQTSYEISALILAIEARSNAFKREKDREKEAGASGKKGVPTDLRVKLPPADQAWMKKLVEQLVRRRQPGRGWRYNMATPPDSGPLYADPQFSEDMSSTQFAMLALTAAERCGFKQPDELYFSVLDWILGMQEKEGPAVSRFVPGAPAAGEGESAPSVPVDHARGWAYNFHSSTPREKVATGSMTACGLATMTIATSLLKAHAIKASEKKLAEMSDRLEPSWWDGMAWLQKNWFVTGNPYGYYHHYYLYCIERAADLKGLHLLGGNHDWYTEGALVFLDQQYPKGFWWDESSHFPCDLLSTCFALLFLERATVAVATTDE